jgi:uncharacterized protein YecE (DUF72 family)
MSLVVGTSGWQYRDWREVVYGGAPPRTWLARYAAELPTVEVNNAFYRLPERSVFARWHDETPQGFVMAVKVSRYLTHVLRLREPAEPVARLVDRAAALEDRLGPYLVQLPPTLRVDVDRLDACLRAFPAGARVAVEPRHDSWWCDEVRTVLERRGAALCWSDRRGRPLTPLWATAGWGYLRLHEGAASPWPSYGRTALGTWLDRLAATWPLRSSAAGTTGAARAAGTTRAAGAADATRAAGAADVFVYFNNDQHAAAVANARTMIRMARRRGLALPR